MKRSRAGTQWFLTYRDLGPPSLRKGGENKDIKEKKRKPQPQWDETIHDLSKFKLTEEELEERRQAVISKNLIQVPRSAVENWVPQFGYDERGRFQDHIAGPKLVSEEHSFASLRQQGKLQPWRPAGTPNFLEQLERPRIQSWHNFRQPAREEEASPSEQQEDEKHDHSHKDRAEDRVPKTAGGAVDFDEEILRFEAKQRLIKSLQKRKKSGASMQGAPMLESKMKQSSSAVDEDPLTSLERGFADLEARLDQHAPARLRGNGNGSSQGPPEKNESKKGEEARTSDQEETSSAENSEGQDRRETRGGLEKTPEDGMGASTGRERVGESSRQGQLQNELHLPSPSAAEARTAGQSRNKPAASRGMAVERKEVEKVSPNAPQQTSHSQRLHSGHASQSSSQEAHSVCEQSGIDDRKDHNESLILQSNAGESRVSSEALQKGYSANSLAEGLSETQARGRSDSQEAPAEQAGQQQTGTASNAGVGVESPGSQEAPGERTGQEQTASASTPEVGVAVPGRKKATVERTAPASNSKTERERPGLALDAMAHLERLSQGLQTCITENRTLQSDFNEYKSHASSILTGLQLHVQKLLEMVPPSSSHVAASPPSILSEGSADLSRDPLSTAHVAPSKSARPFDFRLPALEEDLVDSIPLPSYAELKSLNRSPDLPKTEPKRPRRSDTVRTSMGFEPVPRSLPAKLKLSLRNSHASR